MLKYDEIPEWLHDYGLIRFQGYDSNTRETKLVHRLYQSTFVSDEDHNLIKANIAMGETIAVVSSPATRDIVSAVSYFQIDGTVIVFFLVTKVTMHVMGLGQMLLRLLLRRARHVHQDVDDDVVLYLLANQTKNKDAWKWYKKRGFHVLEKRPSFSPNMVAAFHNHVDPAIKKYLKSKSSLQWLSKKLDVTTDYELKKVLILQGMFVNPYALWKPNAYAMLPSHVSLHELDKCMPTSKVKAIKHLFALPKQTIANYTIPVAYSHTVYVTWVSRTFQLSGKTTFEIGRAHV